MFIGAFMIPAMVCGTAFFINFIAIYYHASRAIPFGTMVGLTQQHLPENHTAMKSTPSVYLWGCADMMSNEQWSVWTAKVMRIVQKVFSHKCLNCVSYCVGPCKYVYLIQDRKCIFCLIWRTFKNESQQIKRIPYDGGSLNSAPFFFIITNSCLLARHNTLILFHVHRHNIRLIISVK